MTIKQAFKPTKHRIAWAFATAIILMIVGFSLAAVLPKGNIVSSIIVQAFVGGFFWSGVGAALLFKKGGLLTLFLTPLLGQLIYGYIIGCIAYYIKYRKNPEPIEINQPKPRLLESIEKIIVLILVTIGNAYLVYYIANGILSRVFLGQALVTKILSFTDFVISLLILFYFWKKWSRSLLVVWTGLFVVVVELFRILTSLSFTSGSFSSQIAAFNLFILFLPFFFILPFLGPVALVYAYFRGLLKQQMIVAPTMMVDPNNPSQSIPVPAAPELTPEQIRKKKIWKYTSIVIGIGLVLLVGWPIYFVVNSGTKDQVQKNDPNVGKIITLGIPMAYEQDNLVASNAPRAQEINRYLSCISDIDSVGAHRYKDKYYNVNYVRSDMKFEIVEVLDTKNTGLAQLGGEGYTYAVLKDEDGLLSTELLDFINDPNDIWCKGRLEGHLDKLFLYIEKAGKARVELTMIDDPAWNRKTDDSTVAGQDRIFKALQSLPSKYHASNLEKVDSYIPDMKAVAADLDGDTLVYLIASSLDLGIWEIKGLDAEYQATLTSSDISDMYKKPLDFRNPQSSNSTSGTSDAIPFINTDDHYQVSIPKNWALESQTGRYLWSRDSSDYGNYMAIVPKGGFDFKNNPNVTPTTSTEKVGGKNATVRTWTSGSLGMKRYYITDTVSAWTKCDSSFSISCGRIEVVWNNTTDRDAILKMVSSIKFDNVSGIKATNFVVPTTMKQGGNNLLKWDGPTLGEINLMLIPADNSGFTGYISTKQVYAGSTAKQLYWTAQLVDSNGSFEGGADTQVKPGQYKIQLVNLDGSFTVSSVFTVTK